MNKRILFLIALMLLFSAQIFAQENDEDDEENDDEMEIAQDSIDTPIDYTHLFNPTNGKAIFVAQNIGNDQLDGSKDKPLQTLTKAIDLAQKNDVIIVAKGMYATDNAPLSIHKSVKIYGSFDDTFTARNINEHASVFCPTRNTESQPFAIMVFDKDIEGTVINGFIFDGHKMNLYSDKIGLYKQAADGALISKTENENINTPLLLFEKTTENGSILIENNVFVNGAWGAIKIIHKAGKVNIRNNVFAANSNTAIEVIPVCEKTLNPRAEATCFDCYIHKNTILFTWGNSQNDTESGCSLRIYGNINYFITNNILANNTNCGIDNSLIHNNDLIRIDKNAFFCNRRGDIHQLITPSQMVYYSTHEFEDISFRSVFSNIHEVVLSLRLDNEYMEGFLNTVFVENKDFALDSHPNSWRESVRIPKKMKFDKKITMFANKYSQQKAVLLFGNDSERGAQKIK